MICYQCNKIGCPELIEKPGYCVKHKPIAFEKLNVLRDRQESASARGYDGKWRKARMGFLAQNPICKMCGAAATVVDHIIPHRRDMTLFYDVDNWQPLCKKCHNRKTLVEQK